MKNKINNNWIRHSVHVTNSKCWKSSSFDVDENRFKFFHCWFCSFTVHSFLPQFESVVSAKSSQFSGTEYRVPSDSMNIVHMSVCMCMCMCVCSCGLILHFILSPSNKIQLLFEFTHSSTLYLIIIIKAAGEMEQLSANNHNITAF